MQDTVHRVSRIRGEGMALHIDYFGIDRWGQYFAKTRTSEPCLDALDERDVPAVGNAVAGDP